MVLQNAVNELRNPPTFTWLAVFQEAGIVTLYVIAVALAI